MAGASGYDYGGIIQHLEPFINPFKDEKFSKNEGSYGEMWEFKDHINGWSFGVNKFRRFVFLRARTTGSSTYINWNVFEKVSIIECVRSQFIVIVIWAVDGDGTEQQHMHSIVIDISKKHAEFDSQDLMNYMKGTIFAPLIEGLQESNYFPWIETSASNVFNRLNTIFTTLDRYALVSCEKLPTLGKKAKKSRGGPTISGVEPLFGGGSGSRIPRPRNTRADNKKRSAPSEEVAGSSRKRRKAVVGVSPARLAASTAVESTGAEAAAGSSVSALTTVTSGPIKSADKKDEIPDF